MRYLVYLLLGLNVAYFVWNQTQPPPEPPEPQLKPLQSDVEPLALLSERNRAREGVVAPAASEVETEGVVEMTSDAIAPLPAGKAIPPVAEIAPVCRTIGPLKSANEATELRDQLSVQGFPATLRQGEIQAPSAYQVYLLATSSDKASEVVSRLESAGMTDYFVGKRNRISLGIFSSRSKAQDRRQAIRELGYDAMLDVRYKTRKVYWIDVEENDGLLENSQGWQMAMVRHPKIKAQRISCE